MAVIRHHIKPKQLVEEKAYRGLTASEGEPMVIMAGSRQAAMVLEQYFESLHSDTQA